MAELKNYLTIRALKATNTLKQEVKKFLHDQTGGGGGDTHITGMGYMVIAGLIIVAVIVFVRALMPTVFSKITDWISELFGHMSF